MSDKSSAFSKALKDKNIPILTLDHKWHQLFTQAGMTPEIKQMSEELNALLAEQGKYNTELKKIKTLKNKLMDEVMTIANDPTADQEKEMEDHKRLIEECNEKMDACSDHLIELPREIDHANKQLMMASMEICYQKLQTNQSKIDEIAAWINDIRIQLKKNVIRKQKAEKENNDLYSYMHDVFGPVVLELFDLKYAPAQLKSAEEILEKDKKENEKSGSL